MATLAAIVSEVIDRCRDGDSPRVSEYVKRYPHLREQIQGHFETIALLERAAAAEAAMGARGKDKQKAEKRRATPHPRKPAHREKLPPSRINEVMENLAPMARRVVFLRNIEKRRWDDIARILGQSETELRRSYAQVIRKLVDPDPSGA